MKNELGCFEHEVLHCISPNPYNDNFKFGVRARNREECLEILESVKENKSLFEEELAKIIGECTVILDFENIGVTVKRVNQKCYPCGYLKKDTGKCLCHKPCIKEN